MKVLAPPTYLSLPDARDILMQCMYDGVAPSVEIEKYRSEGLDTVDAKQAMAAAKALRQPILAGQIDLFAVFSSRDTPMRLHDKALIDAALFPSNSTVLTFAYVDRHFQAPFGLSWSDLKELTRDPLCVKERAFRGWVRKQERRKSWPCHKGQRAGPTLYAEAVIAAELPESFWTGMLPQLMDTSSSTSPYFLAFKAAQAKLGDKGFLSRDITVRDLLLNRSDVHHVFPRNYLKSEHGLGRGRYNQIANFVVAQSEINIAIGDAAPDKYFKALRGQVNGGSKQYGAITDEAELRINLAQSCIPDSMLDGPVPSYDSFLVTRRGLMAQKIKTWFESL